MAWQQFTVRIHSEVNRNHSKFSLDPYSVIRAPKQYELSMNTTPPFPKKSTVGIFPGSLVLAASALNSTVGAGLGVHQAEQLVQS